jgi:hypothetical protein
MCATAESWNELSANELGRVAPAIGGGTNEARGVLPIHETLREPIHLLPTEILTEIFVWGSVEFQNPFYYHELSNTVSQVCRRWRKVSLETACIWSRIRLDLNTCSFIEWSRICPVLEEWSFRASSMGMELQLSLEPGDFPEPNTWLCMDAIRSLSHRWKSITMTDLVLDVEFRMSTCCFSTLKALTLDCHGENPYSLPLNVPNLQSLSLLGSLANPNLYDPRSLPWAQLTSLRLTLNPSVIEDQLEALSVASQTLEELTLVEEDRPTNEESSDLIFAINFPKLRFFTQINDAPVELDLFTMPALQSLHFEPSTRLDTQVARLLDRSGCIIEQFYLNISHLNKPSYRDVEVLLGEIPTLRHLQLKIGAHEVGDAVSETLARHSIIASLP